MKSRRPADRSSAAKALATIDARLNSIEGRLHATEAAMTVHKNAILAVADAVRRLSLPQRPPMNIALAQALANNEILREEEARRQKSKAASAPQAKSLAKKTVSEWIGHKYKARWIPKNKKFAFAECKVALHPTVVTTRVFDEVWSKEAPSSWKRPGRR